MTDPDYHTDTAHHAHAGDGELCATCGEHRSWHPERATMTRLDDAIEDLFTNGSDEKADRLVLAKDDGSGWNARNFGRGYRNLGGRNRQSVKGILLRHFPELAALDEPTKGPQA